MRATCVGDIYQQNLDQIPQSKFIMLGPCSNPWLRQVFRTAVEQTLNVFVCETLCCAMYQVLPCDAFS